MARPSSICLSCGPRAVRMVAELAPGDRVHLRAQGPPRR